MGKKFCIALSATRQITLALALTSAVALFASGCGYTLQTSQSILVKQEDVHTLYIQPVVNYSLRVGIENAIYNSLVKTFSSHKTLKLVQNKEDADVILDSRATRFSVNPSASTPGNALVGEDRIKMYYAGVNFNTYYDASLGCFFELRRRVKRNNQREILWNTNLTRTKRYPAFLQLGKLGTTSALITDTALERAISEMSSEMMEDVHEAMLTMF